MRLTILFEYDTVSKVSRVVSRQPAPPFGLGDLTFVLHESHYTDEAKKALRRAVTAAIAGNLSALTKAR